jgi:hypothetical protein
VRGVSGSLCELFAIQDLCFLEWLVTNLDKRFIVKSFSQSCTKSFSPVDLILSPSLFPSYFSLHFWSFSVRSLCVDL